MKFLESFGKKASEYLAIKAALTKMAAIFFKFIRWDFISYLLYIWVFLWLKCDKGVFLIEISFLKVFLLSYPVFSYHFDPILYLNFLILTFLQQYNFFFINIVLNYFVYHVLFIWLVQQLYIIYNLLVICKFVLDLFLL